MVIAVIGFCWFNYFKRRYIFRDSSLSHQETGTITFRDIPKFQNNLQNNLQNNSKTVILIFHHTARLTSNTKIPSQRVDSPSLTEGGSSGFSTDGLPPPSARIIPLELQMQIGKEIMTQREDSRISLLLYLGSKYKLSDLPSTTLDNRPCSL
ncbi:12583_t:CDS:2 [Cetraspora pellucida]|uniref:12583_t:CDS:1 n=1 Tax=Cetraspora pellucida TaxID=1433469 RepID=A0A9N9C126_9GLOM|nr:12583_t:CDS:2 [Cetraspora pellucida]